MKKNLFEMGANFDEGWVSDNKNTPKPQKSIEIKPPEKHQLFCQKEKRRGKVVTIVQPFYLEKKALQGLLKSLKKELGTGGTLKENRLEFQGDIAPTLQGALEKYAYRFKK
jgi:translation initiation factor 1